MEKASILVLSSTESYQYAESVRDNLSNDFQITLWREGLFNENNQLPLNTFLKKLLYFDAAIIILGNDDVRLDTATNETTSIPRDNVVFELGATMARYGRSKTFMLTPKSISIKMPSYFNGLSTLTYEQRNDGNTTAATGQACTKIKQQLNRLGIKLFHSDLPAIGLAHGYFSNFVLPTTQATGFSRLSDGHPNWKPEDKLTITIVMPSQFMTRKNADTYCEKNLGAKNVQVKLQKGRDMSAYVLARAEPETPVHIIDIPTTFLTSREIIEEVDNYWGREEDDEFRAILEKREIANFLRQIRRIVAKRDDIDEGEEIYVVHEENLAEHIKMLRSL